MSRKAGIIQVALSGLFFGCLGVVGKSLFAHGVTAGELLALRFTLSALVLWPVIWIRLPGEWRLEPRQIAVCAGLGVAGYALFSSCFFMALGGLSASLAVLLLYTYPVMVAAFAWVFWGDRIPRSKWPAIPMAMLGLVLLVWGELSVERYGALLLGVASAVFYSVYILASSRCLKRIHPLVSVTYILTFGGIALAAIHLRSAGHVLGLIQANWLAIAVMVAVGTVGAMSLFLAGLQKLHPWEVSLLSTLEPLTGVVLATSLLGERLSAVQSLGAAGVLGALVFVSLPGPGFLQFFSASPRD
jgi:drug/metabolite transporter (DMT)-like permease